MNFLQEVFSVRFTINFLKISNRSLGNKQDGTHRKLTFSFYRIGSRGGITQVKVIFLNQSARTLVRNVKGPVRKGDVLALLESEREARRLR